MKSQDDDDRKNLSILLRDVSDGRLKKLRAKTVRKIVPEKWPPVIGTIVDRDTERR